jgi:hypothetical protein
MLFTQEDKRLLLHKVHIFGSDHIDKLDDDFTTQETNKFEYESNSM